MTDWLKLAKGAYDTSTSYVDNNFRKRWEDNLFLFQNKHPSDSKYNTEAYKHRSKIFRPKTRSAVRRNEAAAAAAFFQNMDVVSVTATNDNDKKQQASAEIVQELLNYRLQKTIPWFQILVGGMQDAMVMGTVCSYQYWKYKEEITKRYVPMLDFMGNMALDESGNPVMQEVSDRNIKEDKPCVELIPIENIRIDPGASWVDPINTSPYVIWLCPMYVCDIKAMMQSTDSKTGQPKWIKADDGVIRSAISQANDSTRQAREGKRQDSKQSDSPVTDFEIAWVHLNIIRQDDEDYVYYTLGTEHLLSDPKPLKDVYFHGERPFVMGNAIIETHKVMPPGTVELGEALQKEANEIVNQRLDNVKLVLNKRWIVKRGAQVDVKSLVRNVAGSVTLANDVTDVQEINWPDVTSSAFAEQDRINVDYDELVGNFSSGSVQTNRKLNETVGGMGLIAQGANQLTEYLIRTFSETWVEKVLRQLMKLEQAYETDQVVLALAADKAQLYQKYGINRVTDELLNQELTLNVNVGMGATDPNMKMQKFMMGMKAFVEMSQVPGVNKEEVGKEIFGHLGYKDGKRFFEQDPQTIVMMQKMQQMGGVMQQMQDMIKKLQAELQNKQQETMIDANLKAGEIASNERIENKKLQLGYEQMLANNQIEHNAQMLDALAMKLQSASTRAMQ